MATRLGWYDGAFVLPDEEIGASGKKVWVHLDERRFERWSRYRTGGDLAGWQEIARLAVGKSRLVLMLGMAFVGPVAAFMEPSVAQVTSHRLLISPPPVRTQ